MRKSRFTESQVVAILKEGEELWRRYKAGETVLGIANALGQRTTNLYRVLQASGGIALVKVCLGPATHDSQD